MCIVKGVGHGGLAEQKRISIVFQTIMLQKAYFYFYGQQEYYLLRIMSIIPLFWTEIWIYETFLLTGGIIGFVIIICFHNISCRDIVAACLFLSKVFMNPQVI